ncbi:MAG: PaaI family thioesterase [Actinobacteria bacterium]|jgi:uncharacterized protein (TIGR00369 family)|nr:MAG: PaaI family thioesterase [Actinomycetota bacterium]
MSREAAVTSTDRVYPRAEAAATLPDHVYRRWARYGRTPDTTYYAALLGLVVEDVRVDYCRMRLPWRPEISQPFGVAHGGALASLLDSSVVPAIGSGYETAVSFATVDMTVQYLGALKDEDAVAEGWITQRGRSVIFCEAEAIAAQSGRRVARAVLTYKVAG